MSTTQRSLRSAAWIAALTTILAAFLAPALVSAWTNPTVTALCAPDADHFEFTVTLDQASNYNYDWSFGSSGPWTTVAGHLGANDLVVVRASGQFWVRLTSDQGLMGQATPNATLCASPSPTATAPVQSESIAPTESATATPTGSATASPTGSVAPISSASASASATTPVESESLPPSHSAPPQGSVLGETGTPTVTLPPTDSLGATAPTADSWRAMLLGMAALVAGGVLATAHRRRR